MGCLIFSVIGFLVGLFFFISGVDEVTGVVPPTWQGNTVINFTVGIILLATCGVYLGNRIVERSKATKAPSVKPQTQEDVKSQPISFLVQELELYDTENRLKGVLRTDGTLYSVHKGYVGKIFEINQDGCVVQNRSTPVVFVKNDGRLSHVSDSLGKVDPDSGLVYKHTKQGVPIGVIGMVRPLSDAYRMGAVASILLAENLMGVKD